MPFTVCRHHLDGEQAAARAAGMLMAIRCQASGGARRGGERGQSSSLRSLSHSRKSLRPVRSLGGECVELIGMVTFVIGMIIGFTFSPSLF
jgi:hypothetical protein